MQKLIYTLFLIVVLNNAFANPVDEATAKLIGFNFLMTKTNSKKISDVTNLNLAYEGKDATTHATCFYVFNIISSKGFVIVSADDNVQPILGYSHESSFDSTNIPIQLIDRLKVYSKDIAYVVQHKINPTNAIKNKWQELLNPSKRNNFELFGSPSSVAPLLQTNWNQSPYYNQLCPSGTLTGCVATAMAQVMKYWNYPSVGTGYNSYTPPNSSLGVQSANFGSTTYQWASMPSSLSSNSTSAQIKAVATLMYHCGVSVNMQYGTGESDAYMVGDGWYNSLYALPSYFGYDDSIQSLSKENYASTAWLNIIKSELNAGRPILWDGHDPAGAGHCFVADGYDVNNLIHFNWGWGGQCNGYYSIDTLNPSPYPSGFNNYEHIIIGIKPSNASYNITLSNPLSSSTVVGYGKPIIIKTNVVNTGTSAYSGSFSAALFDSTSNLTNYTLTLNSYSVNPNSTIANGLTFSSADTASLSPGIYTAYIYYNAPGGNWQNLVSDGNFPNFTTITVLSTSNVADTIYTTTNKSVCSSQLPYSWNGNLYYQAGTYNTVLSTVNDTTTIGILNLSVKNPSSSTTTIDICSSKLPYKWNGSSYTASGTYSKNFTNSVGCDSVATLILYVSVVAPTTDTIPISGCGSVVYNGKTYTSNTVLHDTTRTSGGCDSLYTIITITLNSSSVPSIGIVCNSSTIYKGSSVSFTATPKNNTSETIFQWRRNSTNISGATSSSYTFDSLNNGDTISCILITFNTCGKIFSVLSNEIIVKVNPGFSVKGNINNPDGKGIEKVLMKLNNADSVFDNSYNFILEPNGSYTIRPTKNNDIVKTNGVSVLDLLLIQSHILGINLLNSPYKIIAADANNDGVISVLDLLVLQRLILGLDTTLPGNRLWAFVDSSYSFPNPANPFPYKDSINFSHPSANLAGQSFVGVKLGDVNYDWNASILDIGTTPNKPISLFYNEMNSSSQSEIKIPIRVKDFKDILGFQFTLNFNNAAFQFRGIENNLLNVQLATNHNNEGKLSFLWNDANVQGRSLPDSTILTELVFTANDNFLNDALSLSSDVTPIAAYDASFQQHNIVMTSAQSSISNYQLSIYPNPAKNAITIIGNHIASVQVIDNMGRIVKIVTLHDATNPVLSVSGLTAGIYHLRIQTTSGEQAVVEILITN